MYWSMPGRSPAVERIWMGDSDVVPGVGHRSDPVLGADVVFSFFGDRYDIRLQGPVTRRTTYPHVPGAEYVGVRFRVGAGVRGPDVSLSELADTASELSRLGGVDLRRVAETAQRATVLKYRATCIRKAIGDPVGLEPSPVVQAALDRMRTRRPVRIREIADSIGVTERHLQRLFLADVGLSPKHTARLIRIHRLLATIDDMAPIDLASLAISVGYFDQSHMTRDVRSVLGTTPAALIREATAPRRPVTGAS